MKPAATASSTPSPAGFPKETATDRTKGRERQRQLLEGELAQEEQLLGQAKRELAQQEATRSGDERNYAKYIERVGDLRSAISRKEADIAAVFDTAISKWGRCDGAWANAGIVGLAGPIAEADMDQFDRTMAVLARGVFCTFKHAARVMVPAGNLMRTIWFVPPWRCP